MAAVVAPLIATVRSRLLESLRGGRVPLRVGDGSRGGASNPRGKGG